MAAAVKGHRTNFYNYYMISWYTKINEIQFLKNNQIALAVVIHLLSWLMVLTLGKAVVLFAIKY